MCAAQNTSITTGTVVGMLELDYDINFYLAKLATQDAGISIEFATEDPQKDFFNEGTSFFEFGLLDKVLEFISLAGDSIRGIDKILRMMHDYLPWFGAFVEETPILKEPKPEGKGESKEIVGDTHEGLPPGTYTVEHFFGISEGTDCKGYPVTSQPIMYLTGKSHSRDTLDGFVPSGVPATDHGPIVVILDSSAISSTIDLTTSSYAFLGTASPWLAPNGTTYRAYMHFSSQFTIKASDSRGWADYGISPGADSYTLTTANSFLFHGIDYAYTKIKLAGTNTYFVKDGSFISKCVKPSLDCPSGRVVERKACLPSLRRRVIGKPSSVPSKATLADCKTALPERKVTTEPSVELKTIGAPGGPRRTTPKKVWDEGSDDESGFVPIPLKTPLRVPVTHSSSSSSSSGSSVVGGASRVG